MAIQTVTLSTLPLAIQKQIPYSIRTYRDVYLLKELPFPVQDLIEEYLTHVKTVSYNYVFDVVPTISKYGDLSVIDNVYSLISEYLKNYFLVLPLNYPFDPEFGCRLKYYIQNLDTDAKRMLITNELNNIISTVSRDLSIPVELTDSNVSKSGGSDMMVEYNLYAAFKINGTPKTLTLSIR